jgi:mono/diheme cytochrome c family protein
VLTPNAALTARGKDLYEKTCATCHGATGKGDGPGAGQLNPKPRNFGVREGWKNGSRIEDIFKTLDEGLKGTSMVSYNYLSKKDRMALVHTVQALGSFDRGNSDPKARETLEKLFASAGETLPNRVPVKTAEAIILGEFQAVPALDVTRSPLLRLAVADPAKAAQTLAAATWKDSDQAFAKQVLAGLPFNGFAPVVATFGPERWKELRSALVSR